MACAQTGSGKTAFYLFPPIHKMLINGHRCKGSSPTSPVVLILGPTRELCMQIFEEALKFVYSTPVKPALVYGGTEIRESLRRLSGGVDILVATPGRLNDLCERGNVSVRGVQTIVLDEADRMLDMGFEPQIRQIIQKNGMPKMRQTVMTSATFPAEVQHLAQEFMRSYSFMAIGRVGGSACTIDQRLVWVEDPNKDNFLFGLLVHQLPLTLIFVNTKQQATDLEVFIQNCGFFVQSIHGDRTQQQRETALFAFKTGEAPILIATDVAARGLDIPDVSLVVQYDLAMSTDDYVHRIGRTGRMGKKGIAIGFMNNRNKGMAGDLLQVFLDANSVPPPFLVGLAISSGNFKRDADGRPQYGGQDVRKSLKKGFQTHEERERARRFAGFNKDAYGQGDEEKAREAAQTVGPAMPGSYAGAVPQRSKGSKDGKKGGGRGGFRGNKDSGPREFAPASSPHFAHGTP